MMFLASTEKKMLLICIGPPQFQLLLGLLSFNMQVSSVAHLVLNVFTCNVTKENDLCVSLLVHNSSNALLSRLKLRKGYSSL